MFTLTRDDYFPNPPAKKDYGIGLIGCGGIVRGAHLPAYKKCGYTVHAACDVFEENARLAAAQSGAELVTTEIEQVLDHPAVEILDLAVHATQRLAVIERICAHSRKPKGILSQKPFAMNYADAQRMVELCEAAGITLMINQQARWAPNHAALKKVIDSGILGHVFNVTHFMRSFQDQEGSWYVALKDFNIVDHGIHYIDLTRHFTGQEPQRVKATAVMMPGQHAVSPMIFTLNLEYAPEAALMSTVHFNNIVQVAQQLGCYEWYVDGTEGSAAIGTHRGDLTIALKSSKSERRTFSLEGNWFPDAFGGSMGELMSALTEGREPLTSGRDNLNSIKIAYAAVESSETGETVTLT